MQLVIGRFAFDVNGASVASRTSTLESDSGRPVRQTVEYDCSFTMLGSSQTDLATKETQIRLALGIPYQDVKLLRNDGGNSGLTLISRQSLSGVRVKSVDFDDTNEPGEYIRYRSGRFTASATFAFPGTANALLRWRQSVSVKGNGGPIRRWRIPVNVGARPIRQQVAPASIVITFVTGQAVGHTGFPKPPPPLYGRPYLVNEEEAVTYGDPTPMGSNWVDWPVNWNYRFETPFVPSGLPALPRM